MKNFRKRILYPLRENFFNGFYRIPPRPGLAYEGRQVVWLLLEKCPPLLIAASFVWRLLRLPKRLNIFEDIYQKTRNKLMAPLYNGGNNYFKFNDHPYRMVMVGDETRPSITVNNGAGITGKIKTEDNCRIRLGISLNETINPKLMDSECNVTAILKDKNTALTNNFTFPVHGENGLFSHKLGESWIDWHMQLPYGGPGGEVELVLKADFLKNGEKYDKIKCPALTWSAPQIVAKNKKKSCHKIIYISIESLSDLLYLQKNVDINVPNISRLMEEAAAYEVAYSQGDATLPVAGTFFTGLLSLQHGITDYKIKPWDHRVKNLSPEIKTIAEILKEKGFYTQAYVFQPRFSPRYGWYRGFDSYKYSSYTLNSPSLPSKFAVNFLEGAKDYDAFLFMHWDGLHDNYWVSEPCSRIVLSNNYSQDYPMSKNSLYAERLRYLDTEVGILIDYLKSSGLWDESLIIVTADHGFGADAWKKHQEFSLYEERIRVPYIVKWPQGHNLQCSKIKEPVNATLNAFLTIHRALDLPLPDYCLQLPQYGNKLNEIAISETVMHPEHDDYACVLISDKFKYSFRCKIDWDNFEMKKFLYHKLSMLKNGNFDDEEDVSRDNKIETESFRNLAFDIVKASLDFQKAHKPIDMKKIPC